VVVGGPVFFGVPPVIFLNNLPVLWYCPDPYGWYYPDIQTCPVGWIQTLPY
jgi:hypothetical protein